MKKVVPAICFALATVVAGSTLSAVSSYAQTSSADEQSCGSADSGEGGAHCMRSSLNRDRAHHERQDRSGADTRG